MAEATVRRDYVNGCSTSPVAFLGRHLTSGRHGDDGARRACSVAPWKPGAGSVVCREFASDAVIDNEVSHLMHEALGFEERERVVCYCKPLD